MRKGFTLLELLIVIIIIGILAVFALPQFFSTADAAKVAKARQVLGEIRSAEVICRGLTGSYDTAWPVECVIPDSGLNAVSLAQPTDAYWTYSITATNAVATKVAATCGTGCPATLTVTFDTGVIA